MRIILRTWFSPVFATLLKQRRDGAILLGAGALLLGLDLLGLPGWVCPFKAVFGIPCPGCGLTTAIGELLRGDWRGSLSTHAFAPIFLLGLLVMVVVTLLPESHRLRWVSAISRIERRTGITAWALAGLFLYWGLRLVGLA